MDYKHAAQQVLDCIGGKDNIVSAAHCATRLRLVIADNAKVNKQELENAEGAKGVFEAQGQLQIIFGTGTVNKVYDEFIQLAGIEGGSKEDVKQAAAAKAPWYQRAIKTLGDIFVPIIPAIVASGFLMGIMEALNFMVNNGFLNIDTTGSVYVFAKLFSNTAYTFLPILIAYSAAKVFGGNPYLGAVIGMIMIHPDLQNAWTVSNGVNVMQPVFGGLYSVPLVGYQGHVIPVIIAVWLMCQIEKRLHKVVPAMFDLFVTPLVSVFVTGYLTLAAIGPVFTKLENGIITGVQTLITLPYGIGSFIMGGLYAVTVVAGIHHMYTLIDLGQLARYGYTYWLAAAGQRRQRGTGRCRSGRGPQEQGHQGQVHGPALCPVRLHGHHRACHLRREPALLQALPRRPAGRCLRRMVRQHRGAGCHRHRRHRHLRHPAAPAYAPAVHHHDGHLLRRVLRRDLGHLEP